MCAVRPTTKHGIICLVVGLVKLYCVVEFDTGRYYAAK